ncbi:unnamed protein product, partial [Larinioides sclopetarius]
FLTWFVSWWIVSKSLLFFIQIRVPSIKKKDVSIMKPPHTNALIC